MLNTAIVWQVTYWIVPKQVYGGRLEALFSFPPKPEHVIEAFRDGLTDEHRVRMLAADYTITKKEVMVPNMDYLLRAGCL